MGRSNPAPPARPLTHGRPAPRLLLSAATAGIPQLPWRLPCRPSARKPLGAARIRSPGTQSPPSGFRNSCWRRPTGSTPPARWRPFRARPAPWPDRPTNHAGSTDASPCFFRSDIRDRLHPKAKPDERTLQPLWQLLPGCASRQPSFQPQAESRSVTACRTIRLTSQPGSVGSPDWSAVAPCGDSRPAIHPTTGPGKLAGLAENRCAPRTSAPLLRVPGSAGPALGAAPDRRAVRAVANAEAGYPALDGATFIGSNTRSCQMMTGRDTAV
jgi:hypothetical protein